MTKFRWHILIALGAVAAWIAVLLVAPRESDFMNFYAAGSLLLRHPHSLYSLTAQWTVEKALGKASLATFAHPAPEALLFAPLALLSYHTAFVAWSAINLCLFVLSGWLLRDEIRNLTPGARYVLLAFVWWPIGYGLMLGQDHGLFLLLWVLAWRTWKADDEFACGLWIGLALLRYPFALPMLFFFVALRKWRLLKGAAVSGIALVIASFLIVGPALIPSYLKLLRFTALISDAGVIHLTPTIRGLAVLILPSHSNAVAAAGIVGLLAWSLVVVQGMERLNAFCFAVAISLLVDPHAFYYDLTILTIPLMLSLKKYPKSALLPLVLCAFDVAIVWTHVYFFVAFCPVLLVWAIWMGCAFHKEESGLEAPLEFSHSASGSG